MCCNLFLHTYRNCYEGNEKEGIKMKIIEALWLEQPRMVIDLIVTYNLDEWAEKVGLQPVVEKQNEIAKLMSHRTYTRVGRRVRKRQGKVIA